MKLTRIQTNKFVGKRYDQDNKSVKSTQKSVKGTFKVLDLTLQQLADELTNMDKAVFVLGTPELEAGTITDDAKVKDTPNAISRTKKYFEDLAEWVLIDIDTSDTISHIKPSLAPQTEEEAIDIFKALFGDVSYLIKPSSSRIAKGSNNWHIYMPLSKPTSLEEIKIHIEYNLHKLGLNCIGLSTSGAELPRNHYCDMSVFSPERLIFEADPITHNQKAIDSKPTIYDNGIVYNPRNLDKPFTQPTLTISPEHKKIAVQRELQRDDKVKKRLGEKAFKEWKQRSKSGEVPLNAPIKDKRGRWITVKDLVEGNVKTAVYSPFEPDYTHAPCTYYPESQTIYDHHTNQRIVITDNIPHSIENSSYYTFLCSTEKEVKVCKDMNFNYIGVYKDHWDHFIDDEIKDKMKDKLLVVVEKDNKEITQRLRTKFSDVVSIEVGYLDECVESFENHAKEGLKLIIKNAYKAQKEKRLFTIEKKIKYDKYVSNQDEVDIASLENGVIAAITGSGKTHSFENKPGVMILVPRVEQADMGEGDKTDYVINKTLSEGSKLTYEKFIGHYKNVEEFRSLVKSKHLKIIVDEAHMILQIKKGYDIIYDLDAVFLSGTIEPFFRPDLQRYKFIPKKPQTIYYLEEPEEPTEEIPDYENALYFAERAEAFKKHYPERCVIGAEHKWDNFDVHSHQEGKVFATSALREGISITTGNYDACIVDSRLCNSWSVKDTIQAVNRVRGDNVLRLMTKPVKKPFKSKYSIEKYLKKAQELTDTKIINTFMGERHSKFIKHTHKPNKYEKASEFGVACHFADMTRNNYDPDFYEFKPYEEERDTFEIKTTTGKGDEDDEMLEYTFKDITYLYPASKKRAFMEWIPHKESGLVDRLMNMSQFENFYAVYERSRTAKEAKAKYNSIYNTGKNPKKYTIKIFYEDIRSIVKLKKVYQGRTVERVSKKMNLREMEVSVVGECPVEGVSIKKPEFKNGINHIDITPLNYSSNAHHTAKTAQKVGRPKIEQIITLKTEQKPTLKTVKTELIIPPDKIKNINDHFLEDISEL